MIEKITLPSGEEVQVRPLGLGASVLLQQREQELRQKYESEDVVKMTRNLEMICQCLVSPKVSPTPDGPHPFVDDVLDPKDAMAILQHINDAAEKAREQIDPLSATAT